MQQFLTNHDARDQKLILLTVTVRAHCFDSTLANMINYKSSTFLYMGFHKKKRDFCYGYDQL
jgi:hypothetical protein